MSGKLLSTEKLLLHVQSPRPGETYHFCRLFAPPAGEIDWETGQPFKPYIGTLLVVVTGDSGEVQGALTLAPSAIRMLHQLGRALNVRTLWWQTWDWDGALGIWLKMKPVVIKIRAA